MDPAEDQAAELEALEAIFMDEFKLRESANDSRGAQFEIELAVETAPDVQLRMDFEYALDYPESAVIVTAHTLAGLSAPGRKALQKRAAECARENIGMPSVFTICEAMKEWIEENVAEDGGMDGDDADDDADGVFETKDVTMAAKVEVIASKAIGTPVTTESFAKWREAFMAEIEAKKTKEEKERESDPRPTGRQLFEEKKAKVVVSGESESFWEQEADEFEEEVA